MKKVFIVVCRAQESEYLNVDKDTLFFSPIYEHTYRKFADAVNHLKIDCEIVRSASYTLEGVTSELIGKDITAEWELVERDDVAEYLKREHTDVTVTFGAGNIDVVCADVAKVITAKIG